MLLAEGEVRLTVPGNWLAQAQYPVVIDPLLGSGKNNLSSPDPADQVAPSVASNDMGDTNYSYEAVWADYRNGNWDIYGRNTEQWGEGNGNPVPITQATGNQQFPAIAYEADQADHRYWVSWQENTGNGGRIKGRYLTYQGNTSGGTKIIADAAGAQSAPALAYNPNSDSFLIVYEDYRTPGGNGDIYARLVNSSGVTLTEYAIASSSAAQAAPAVTYDSVSDKWVITWQQGGDIWARAADGADGNPHTWPSSPVTQTSLESEQAPDVAYNPADNQAFVVYEVNTLLCQTYEIRGLKLVWNSTIHIYQASGSASALSGCVEPSAHRYPRVVYGASAHEYVVTWQTGNGMIEAQQVDSTGEAFTAGNYAVEGSPTDQTPRGAPAIAYNSSRNQFLITWQEQVSSPGIETAQYDILDRALDNSFIIDEGEPIQPAVAEGPDYQALVTWQDGGNIYGQIVDQGEPVGTQLTICDAANAQTFPAVAYDRGAGTEGLWLVIWQDARTDSGDIYGRTVAPDGTLGTEQPIRVASGIQSRPALDCFAFSPTVHKLLAVWEDGTTQGTFDIDGASITLSPWNVTLRQNIGSSAGDDLKPDVVANSGDTTYSFLVTWEQWVGTTPPPTADRTQGRFTDQNGVAGSSLPGTPVLSVMEPALTWDNYAGKYLLVGRRISGTDAGHVIGWTCNYDGSTFSSEFDLSGALIPDPGYSSDRRVLDAKYGGWGMALVSWEVGDYSPIYGRRVDLSSNTPSGASFPIWAGRTVPDTTPLQPVLASWGGGQINEYMVTWYDHVLAAGYRLRIGYLFFP